MEGVSRVSYRIVGPGRVGRSLQRALEGTHWHHSGDFGRHDDPADAGRDVDVVVVSVPDDAIAKVARAITPTSAALIHLSGAKTLQVLEPHRRRASVHPLMSLPDADTGAARLRNQATFAIAGDQVAADLVATLGGHAIEIPDENRVLYHAAATVAANHLVALCAQVERLATRIGVPVDRYWELMSSTLTNVQRIGPTKALTGPAARGDSDTISNHVQALVAMGDDDVEFYRVAAAAAARLGQAQPTAPPLSSDRPPDSSN